MALSSEQTVQPSDHTAVGSAARCRVLLEEREEELGLAEPHPPLTVLACGLRCSGQVSRLLPESGIWFGRLDGVP